MKDLQKTQNKALRFLNKTRIKDKISTKSILEKMNMLSVNQLNAQIKLTETWKLMNNKKSSLKNLVIKSFDSERVMRSVSKGELIEEGSSILSKNTFQNDSARLWNKSTNNIKESESIYSAKKLIKVFVKTLPI